LFTNKGHDSWCTNTAVNTYNTMGYQIKVEPDTSLPHEQQPSIDPYYESM